MQIKLNLKIFIFILLFILTRQIEIYGILMLFAVIHELGHMVAGMALGFNPKSFTIMPFGVSVAFKVPSYNYNKKIGKANMLAIKKMIIALAGPLTNILITIMYCLWDISFLGMDRQLVIYSNILLGIFNLIPIYPLDGGRILKNMLHILYGLEEAYHQVNLVSNVTIAILTGITSIAILYFRNIAILLILGYLWYLVIKENKHYKNKIKIYEILHMPKEKMEQYNQV
ncbi:MAG: site-2 protease family protein [Clostridia bacterium]